MVEIRDGKKVLVTPISAEDLADIKAGDVIYLDGDLMTCRDVAHRRLVEYGRDLPYGIRDKAIFHAGPIVRPIEDAAPGEPDYEMVSVGPTTSMRMEKFEYEFVKQTGVRVLVGKGGMGPNTERACREFGAIHCVFPPVAPWSPPRRWNASPSIIGRSSVCLRRFGAARFTGSAP